MNQQMGIYNDYKAKNESLQNYTIVHDVLELRSLLQNSTYLTGTSHTGKAGQFGDHEGTYLHKDGRVWEKFCSFGWNTKAVVFENEEAWKKHQEAMSFFHYSEC